jgi:mono/diheme cytochrome c family protein
MKRYPLAIPLLVLLAIYGGLKLVVPPLPSSLIGIYMAMATIAVLLFVSSREDLWMSFGQSLLALCLAPERKIARSVVLVFLPCVAGFWAYSKVAPEMEPPAGIRVIHPAPPAQIDFRGKTLQISGLENPLRKDKDKLPQYIQEGKQIYFQNCFVCHGDNLSGKGQFAPALRPPPANFQDVGTIAMLQESFVFWRVAKGGPGLPPESTPWDSAMPVWETMLTDDQIWKVILYIYDGTGHTPRTWETAEAKK